ncbi:hypothetical protein AgCh_006548 [Apium graveolens]
MGVDVKKEESDDGVCNVGGLKELIDQCDSGSSRIIHRNVIAASLREADIEPNITGFIIEGNDNSIEINISSKLAKNLNGYEVIDISKDDNKQSGDNSDSAVCYYSKNNKQVMHIAYSRRDI